MSAIRKRRGLRILLSCAFMLIPLIGAIAQSWSDRIESDKERISLGMSFLEVQDLIGPPPYHSSEQTGQHTQVLWQYKLRDGHWLTVGFLDETVAVIDDGETGRRIVRPPAADKPSTSMSTGRIITNATLGHIIGKGGTLYVVEGYSPTLISTIAPAGAVVAPGEVQDVALNALVQAMGSAGYYAFKRADVEAGKIPEMKFARIIFVRLTVFVTGEFLQLPMSMDEYFDKSRSTIHAWSASAINVPASRFLIGPAQLMERILNFYGEPSKANEIDW